MLRQPMLPFFDSHTGVVDIEDKIGPGDELSLDASQDPDEEVGEVIRLVEALRGSSIKNNFDNLSIVQQEELRERIPDIDTLIQLVGRIGIIYTVFSDLENRLLVQDLCEIEVK